jgi:hypothetical protein
MGYEKLRTPKLDDCVTIRTQQSNVFAVAKVRKESKTADLILLPRRDFIEKEVPWGSLVYMDEEEVNQVAARIVGKPAE